LISAFASKKTPLELTIVHADAPTLVDNLSRNDRAAQVALYTRLTNRLVSAGADCVVVTSVAGHFCIDAFADVSPLPVVSMIAEVDRAIRERDHKRIGVIGTRTVMESRFYGGVTSAEINTPSGRELDEVHQAYVAMAVSGVVSEAQRLVFETACSRMLGEKGANAIMLGGTDLALAFNEQNADFPLVDCAAIHVDAIVRLATG
jgi:aspartate racemase